MGLRMGMKGAVWAGLLSLSGCAGRTAFTRGEYADPAAKELLSDRFNASDLHLLSDRAAASLLGAKLGTPRPTLVVGRWENRTHEHVDVSALQDAVVVQLQRSGQLQVLDRAARTELAEEYDYQASGYVVALEAKAPGEQASADYLLTGELTSLVEEVGTDKVVYYRLTTKLTQVRTGLLEWSDQQELRKKFERQWVGL